MFWKKKTFQGGRDLTVFNLGLDCFIKGIMWYNPELPGKWICSPGRRSDFEKREFVCWVVAERLMEITPCGFIPLVSGQGGLWVSYFFLLIIGLNYGRFLSLNGAPCISCCGKLPCKCLNGLGWFLLWKQREVLWTGQILLRQVLDSFLSVMHRMDFRNGSLCPLWPSFLEGNISLAPYL